MGSDSSDDDRVKTKMVKLNRSNWSIWKSRLSTIIIGKGYEDLMNGEWTEKNGDTKEYRQMCAWTVNKLYATVEEDLHPIIIANEKNVFNALTALGAACGESSVVVMCDKLFHLVNLPPYIGHLYHQSLTRTCSWISSSQISASCLGSAVIWPGFVKKPLLSTSTRCRMHVFSWSYSWIASKMRLFFTWRSVQFGKRDCG